MYISCKLVLFTLLAKQIEMFSLSHWHKKSLLGTVQQCILGDFNLSRVEDLEDHHSLIEASSGALLCVEWCRSPALFTGRCSSHSRAPMKWNWEFIRELCGGKGLNWLNRLFQVSARGLLEIWQRKKLCNGENKDRSRESFFQFSTIEIIQQELSPFESVERTQ